VTTGQEVGFSLSQGPDIHRYGGYEPLVDLLIELAPRLARPVAVSLITEALDQCADLLLCEAWAQTRQRLAPVAIRCAHRHSVSYASRRAVELGEFS
jgi:hypothetical protein